MEKTDLTELIANHVRKNEAVIADNYHSGNRTEYETSFVDHEQNFTIYYDIDKVIGGYTYSESHAYEGNYVGCGVEEMVTDVESIEIGNIELVNNSTGDDNQDFSFDRDRFAKLI